jgi:hypothetical protein
MNTKNESLKRGGGRSQTGRPKDDTIENMIRTEENTANTVDAQQRRAIDIQTKKINKIVTGRISHRHVCNTWVCERSV